MLSLCLQTFKLVSVDNNMNLRSLTLVTLQEPHHPDYFVHTNYVYKFCSTTVMVERTLARAALRLEKSQKGNDHRITRLGQALASGPNNTSMFTPELTQQKPSTLSDEEHHISLPTGHST